MENDTYVVRGVTQYQLPEETIGKIAYDWLIVKDAVQLAMVSS